LAGPEVKSEQSGPEVKLVENTEPELIHYHKQEQTSYDGRFFINIQFPEHEEDIFKSNFRSGRSVDIPITTEGSEKVDDISLKNAVIKALTSSFSDRNLFPNLGHLSGILRFVEKPGVSDSKSILEAYSTLPISRKLARLDVDEVVSMIRAGKRLCIYRSMYGALTYSYVRFDDLDIEKVAIPYGPPSDDTYQHYIRIKSVNGRHPPNGLNISCTSGFCITVRGNARPKHKDLSYTDQNSDKRYRRHTLPPFIYQVQKVCVSFESIPESSCFEGTATQDSPGSWDDWTFKHEVYADDPSGAGQKSFVIIATAYYESLDPEEASIGIVVSFTAPGTPDNIHPSVRITSPREWENKTGDFRGLPLLIEGTASDHPGGSGIRSVEVTIDDDIGLYTEVTPRHHSWSTWTASKNIVSSGIHTITARCTDNAGNVEQDRIPISVTITPRLTHTNLFLVERYRLSSYLGKYHTGKIINTISLLAGEKTKVNVETFASSEKERRELSSCILDSLTEYSADDFEACLACENAENHVYDESGKYYITTQCKAGWGFGSCKLTSAFISGTISAREEFAKDVSNAIHKHVWMASAKRDIRVEADCEIKAKSELEEKEKHSTKCEIRNINPNRTLNLNFRQLNQEFISILHLVDVRVAVLRREYLEESRCLRIKYQEVTLPQLDAFLDEILVKDERELKQQVTEFILNQLYNILNYDDCQRCLIEDRSFKNAMGKDIPGSNYLRVMKDLNDTYVDPDNPYVKITVPGIIMSVSKNVLRTEGVLVEPLIGHKDTLDDYSRSALERIELSNELKETEISRNNLGIKLVNGKDTEGAKIFGEVFPCCKSPIFSLWPLEKIVKDGGQDANK
jgi:hypothetical protein